MIDKKSMKDVLDGLKSHETLEEYYRDNSYSYSKIKNCYYDPSSLFKRDQPPSIFMDIGSAVDIMLTSPLESHRIKPIKKIPSDTNINIAHYLLFNHPNIKSIEELTDDIIIEAYDVVSPKNKWTPPVKKTKFLEDTKEYYNIKIQDYDAVILTHDIYNTVLKIVETLRTHDVTKHLFNEKYKDPDTLIYYQYSYKESSYHKIPIKILMDIMEVNLKSSTIQQYDLKVGDNSFFKSYWKFKWYYQAGLYREVGETLCNKISDIFGLNQDYLSMFSTLPFQFIHIQPSKPNYPVIYTVTEGTHNDIVYTGFKDNTYETPSLHKILRAVEFYDTYLSTIPENIEDIKKDLVPYHLVENHYHINI